MVQGSSLAIGVGFGAALGLALFVLVVAIASTGENAAEPGGDDGQESETP